MPARLTIPSLGAILVTLAVILEPVCAEEFLPEYYAGLRQRSLYVVAEEYAIGTLSGQALSPRLRTIHTVELSQSLAEHGSHVEGEERAEFWREAERVVRDLIANDPSNPRYLQLEAQLAMLPAERGEAVAWSVRVVPEDRPARDMALRTLDSAIRSMTDLLHRKFGPNRVAPTAQQLAEGALTRSEMKTLERRIRLTLARAQVTRAELTISQFERANALNDLPRTIAPLLDAPADRSIRFAVGMLRAKASRLLDDLRRAESELEELQEQPLARSQLDAVLAEQIRVYLSEQRPEAAISLVNDRLVDGTPLSDELRAVAVQLLLEARQIARRAGQDDLAATLLQQAQEHHQLVQGRWKQWSHVMVEQMQDDLELGVELADAMRSARWAYHAGRFDEALAGYASASRMARERGLEEAALEWDSTRASILLEQRRWDEGIAALDQILRRAPGHATAAQTDLLRCYALGQLAQRNSDPVGTQTYEQALLAHRETYPSSTTSTDAVWLLALDYERRMMLPEMLLMLRDVPADHPRFDDACLRRIDLYERILTHLTPEDGLADWEPEIERDLKRIKQALLGSSLPLTSEQCRVALGCAQLVLRLSNRDYADAYEWIERIDQSTLAAKQRATRERREVDPEWSEYAHQSARLRIISLAGQERIEEARQVLSRLGRTNATELLGLLRGLTEMSAKVDPDQKRDLGRLQHQTIGEISSRRAELDEEQLRLLDECTAQAFIATGDLSEAASVYESLRRQTPKDKDLIRSVIEVYVLRGHPEDLEAAKDAWIKLEQLEPPGSENWIRARLEVASLLIRLGRLDEARKLLGITKTLYPRFNSTELEQVLRSLEDALTPSP